MMTLAAVAFAQVSHEFRYVSDRVVDAVYVAGSFNGWSATANRMETRDGRTFSLRLDLPYGEHQYKFVLNGRDWIVDPKAVNRPDGNGNTNSILTVLPTDYAKAASKGDGVIAKSALLHDASRDLNYDQGRYVIRLRVRPDDVASVTLVVGTTRYAMREVGRDSLYAYYSIGYRRPLGQAFSYQFELRDGAATELVGPYRLDPKAYRPFVVPAWVEKSVFYQIFPDRFKNGRRDNDPAGVQPWNGNPTYGNRFGGDLAGIRQEIPYLSRLGVRSIYLNPVFASPSNHRYEADSYELIDKELGSNAEFVDLGKALKAKGMGVVMDLALNHTSPNFFAFQDIREKERASKYLSWYTVRDFPVRVGPNPNYEAWYGFPSMPKLNTMNPP
ncbi:MAG: alpha amylase N-terminal ig-like domain-containing protein, partial [Fimbriimonadaceae bacterium]|nr:alpha amylase N-terminal ig-like domain-containing protein [Fimbriimonadaceae bacterium]